MHECPCSCVILRFAGTHPHYNAVNVDCVRYPSGLCISWLMTICKFFKLLLEAKVSMGFVHKPPGTACVEDGLWAWQGLGVCCQCKSLLLQVILTAGYNGEIKVFENLGAPQWLYSSM